MAAKDVRIKIKVDGDTRKLEIASKDLQKIDRSAGTASTSLTGLAGSFKKIAISAGVLYGISKAIGGIVSAGKAIVNTSAEFEKFETILKTLSGSARVAEEQMNWITEFATTTPYQVEQVTEAFVKLKAYGLEPMNGLLRTLGDTSAAMGKPLMQAVEAMADAVTGENERLKEFGIKASVTGDQIKYTWTTASGEIKQVVVANNREIIQSTLEAIFNERYSGAMQQLSSTWDGMVSNLSDKWTKFKKDLGDTGAFSYIKAVLKTIVDNIGGMFDSIVESSRGWVGPMINGFEALMVGAGKLGDIFEGIGASFSAAKAAFMLMVIGIGEGINLVGAGWEALKAGMINATKEIVDTIGQAFTSMLQWLAEQFNGFVQKVSGWIGQIPGAEKFAGKIGSFEWTVADYKSPIAEAAPSSEPVIDLAWSYGQLNDALRGVDESLDAVISKKHEMEATEGIAQIELAYAQMKNSPLDLFKTLHDVEDEQNRVTEAVKKSGDEFDRTGKKAGRAGKAAKQAAKETTDEWKRAGDAIASKVGDAFEGFFRGLMDGTKNFGDIMKNMLKEIAMELIRILFIEKMVKAISGAIGGLGGLGAVSAPSPAITAYARGGVVRSPVAFSHAGGIGIAGEAGPEAIMPLTRTSGGDLGVKVEAAPVQVNVVNNTSSDVEVQQDEDGTIDIIINKIATDIARGTGTLPGAFESRYGLTKR